MNYTIDAKENIIPLKDMELKQVRALWKECFHDTEAYMDFYFSWKTKDNVIFGLYDEERLISMLHLNPYQLSVYGDKVNSYYIVGVATDESYRKRGLMRKLLVAAMKHMYEEQVPFTYLMPAKEEIYLPFDFRIITTQKRMSIPLFEIEMRYEEPQLTAAEIKSHSKVHQKHPHLQAFLVDERQVGQLEELAQFANHKLSQENEVYTVRDSAYYERMIAELQVSHGGIFAMKEGKKLLGYSAFAVEDGKLEVLEFLCNDDIRDELMQNMYPDVMNRLKQLDIAIDPQATPSQAPPIMARIIHVKKFLEGLRAMEATTVTINVSDPLIVENNGVFTIHCDQEQSTVTQHEIEAYHEVDLDLVCRIQDLTRLFFGQMSDEELLGMIPEKQVKAKQKFKQLSYYGNVHINEIV